MTPKELDEALDRLGWTGADAARTLGIHPTTVSAWRTGNARIPGPAAYAISLTLSLVALVPTHGRTT
jgi:DNA-binding transcriptional regulator YdaS (Cro superfamily)